MELIQNRMGERVTHQPGWEEPTGNTPRPWLLVVVVGRHDTSPADDLDEPDHRVEQDVRADATNEAVGDGVGERHEEDCDDDLPGFSRAGEAYSEQGDKEEIGPASKVGQFVEFEGEGY